MAEPLPEPTTRRLAGYAVLAAAVIFAAFVALYFVVFSGDDDDMSLVAPPTGGPPSSVTPPANTGVLDPERPEVGQPAPNFALLDVRDGATLRTLASFRGTPVVVNWFASWCGPCKAEMPEFQRAQDKLGNNVVFLGVNYDEDRSRALSFLQRVGSTYPAVLDSGHAVADHYRVGRGLPVTFFIDADGILRSFKTGRLTKKELETFLATIGLDYEAP
ncbi:MAG: TlpA family protein disulfide reductase [Tepidiformaceae bacterium]